MFAFVLYYYYYNIFFEKVYFIKKKIKGIVFALLLKMNNSKPLRFVEGANSAKELEHQGE